jgi:hypothetical protein
MNKIVQFNTKLFYKKVLRKRTNIFGIKKNEDEILVCKKKPLSTSLTMISEEDDKIAVNIFKHLLKIIEEAHL